MKKEEVITKLKKVKPILSQKYGLTSIALFGSYSREEQTDNSDIDLLLYFSDINTNNFFGCAFELQDLFQNKKVDIITSEGIKPRYFEAIKKELIYA